MDKLLLLLGIGFLLWCLGDGIVRIIRAANGGGSNKHVKELRAQIEDLEEDLVEARQRIEVLESIVTDGRHELRKKIDELGS